MKNDWKRKLRRLWARMTGRVLISDYVNVTLTLSEPMTQTMAFNPDLIIGKRDLV